MTVSMLTTVAITVILALVIWTSECSVVLDILNQGGIHISDYCPKMKYCPEGAHVMCMHYDPKHLMGPRCSNPKNVSITHELANKLLEVSNAVRSKIALGKEKGKGGNYLPKGYGIFRLKWDSELATFAQVLANQCVLKHDLCRATKKFPDPGQTAGLVRFSYPDWYPVSKTAHFTTPGLSNPKLFYAITQTLKSWYGQKNSVSSDMITSYPDWSLNPNHQEGRLYLEMIYGPATHMGCGISAYTEYAYYDNNAPLNYNSVQVICNYSSRPRKLGPVYNTMPPTTAGFSSKCGCPPGSEEDDNCLCQESSRPPPNSVKHMARKCMKGDVNCDPTVVVLPIFTMEDAPAHKLIPNSYGNANESLTDNNSLEIFDYYEKSEPKHALIYEHNNNNLNDVANIGMATARSATRSGIVGKQILDVKNRYFNRKANAPNPTHHHIDSHKVQRSPQRRQSVFTKAQTFALPFMKGKYSDNTRKFNVIKKDVAPRKNFDSAQILVKKYMTRKITNDPYMKIKKPDEVKPALIENNFHENGFTETTLDTVEDKVIDYSRYLNDNNISGVQRITQNGIEATDQLITLLDNLENILSNTELRGKGKEIVVTRIKKIYERVTSKLINSIRSDDNPETNIDNISSETNAHNKKYTDIRTDAAVKYSNVDYNKRPVVIARNQNSVIKSKNTDMELTDNIKDYPQDKFIVSGNTPRYPRGYADELKPRNVYKSGEEKSVYANEINDKLKHKNEKTRITKKYMDFDTYDDPLSPDRRKYYQKKLERLEKRIRNTRKNRNTLERDRGVPPVRPTEDLHTPTRSKNQLEETFYPERARFLNGFR